MLNELEKLKTLRIIPSVLALLALVYFLYTIDKSISIPKQVVYGKRTVEEIINTPQPFIPSEPWDNDFKSAITPAEEVK
jgi:hypothetical protein